VRHRHVSTLTTPVTGVFKTDSALQERFLNFCSRK
jgi:GTP cyclohydrolase I